MNSRTTATRSSSGSSVMHLNSTTMASCAGVSVVLSLCGRWDRSCGVSLLFHLAAVARLML